MFSPFHSRFPGTGARSLGRWLLWIPILMVAALLYWTVALGLGGLSLIAVTALSAGGTGLDAVDVEIVPADLEAVPQEAADATAGLITIRLQESVEPEDVNDNPGAGSSAFTSEQAREQQVELLDDVVQDPAAVATPGPGPGLTAF